MVFHILSTMELKPGEFFSGSACIQSRYWNLRRVNHRIGIRLGRVEGQSSVSNFWLDCLSPEIII